MKKSNYIFLLYFVFTIEILLWIFNLLFQCSCGHHLFKVLPALIFFIIEIRYYLKICKNESEKLSSDDFVIGLIKKSIIIFI